MVLPQRPCYLVGDLESPAGLLSLGVAASADGAPYILGALLQLDLSVGLTLRGAPCSGGLGPEDGVALGRRSVGLLDGSQQGGCPGLAGGDGLTVAEAKFPVTDVFTRIEIADGRVWMLPSGIGCFAGDLPEEEQQIVWATAYPPAAELFASNAPGVAWRTKPSWYIVASNDRSVHPELERAAAKRMGATTYELDSNHVPMLSQPDRVLDVIRTAASAV